MALVTGCGSATEQGADARAERAGIVMDRVRFGSAKDMAWRVVGGDPNGSGAGASIEALAADGDRLHGKIVLRITERHENGESWSSGPAAAVRCYQYLLRNTMGDDDPHRINCPHVRPLILAPPAPLPTVPPGIESPLIDALEALSPQRRTAANVKHVATTLAGDAPVVAVATVGDTVGLAIGDGRKDCTAAMVTATQVVVWHVPWVLAQPGELGCSAEASARGLGQDPPH